MARKPTDEEFDKILRLACGCVKDFLTDSSKIITELGESAKFEDADAYEEFWEKVFIDDYTPECEWILAEALAKALENVPGFDEWYAANRHKYIFLEPEPSGSDT